MDPITGGLLIGGANLLGSVFGTQQNNQNSQAMLQQQEAYQTQMSNTAYQRASHDMTAAGLNPMMMFGSGGAASTPSVQPAQMNSAAGAIGPSMEKAITSATALKTADATINNLVEQNAKIKADTLTTNVLREPERELKEQQGRSEFFRGTTIKDELPKVLDEALSADNRRDMNPTVRKLLDQAGFAGRKVDDVMSPISNLVSSAIGAGKYIRGY